MNGGRNLPTKRILFVLLAVLAMLAPAVTAHATDPDLGCSAEIYYTTTRGDINCNSDTTHMDDLSYYAEQLGSPVLIYEFLRNNAEYDLYDGSRSGSQNSFLGLRGNDVDLASSLIAMLRQQGFHSRYVVGTVKMSSAQLMNWLGVQNVNLAVTIMKTQGIQNVTLNSDNTVSFEHVWVEAEVPFGEYRGAGMTPVPTTTNCTTNPTDCYCTSNAAACYCSSNPVDCHWVALDASFKQKNYNNTGIDPYKSGLQFDYTNYYNAIYNANQYGDTSRLNKNPLEIYQEQVLGWLQTNYAGKTLDDASYKGNIITEDNLILPASLPYTVAGNLRRYNSVKDHDSAESVKWAKGLSLELGVTLYDQNNNPHGYTINLTNPLLLVELASWPLVVSTVTDSTGNPNVILSLGIPSQGGIQLATLLTENSISGYTPMLGDAFSLVLTVDGPAGSTPQPVEYDYCTVGGYYLIATGGETSNWGQVFNGANSLLYANQQQYKIVFNPSENGCNPNTGVGCTPYVDSSGKYHQGDPT
jgi:hypothetical protein